jgi:hypothetical protein
MPAKSASAPKTPPAPRMSFYPYPQDLAILESIRADLQARTPHVAVSLSDALRHAIREYPCHGTVASC